MARDVEKYRFSPQDAVSDIEHFHCMRIRIREDKPTVEDVQHMLYELYIHRNVKLENIFIEPQDLRDMSYVLKRESEPYYSYPYFVDNDINENSRFSGGCIKRVWYGVDPAVRVYPCEFLERGFVIVGFLPIRINVQTPRMDWGNWASLLTDKDES